MKKLSTILFTALMAIVLAACGDNTSDAPANNDNASANNNEEVNAPEEEQAGLGEDTLDAEELYEKITVANAELESFSTKMDMEQSMNIDGENMDFDSKLDMDVVQNPFSLKQIMTMELPEVGEQSIEAYLTEDGFYMFEPEQEQWMKLPSELSEQIIQQSESQADLQSQLAQFDGLQDGLSVDETDDHYVLKFKSTDDSFDQVFQEAIENNMPPELGIDTSMFEDITFNDVQYELFVHKDNYYMSELNMIMDYDMEIEGEKLNTKQNIKSTYDNYNEIDEIKVPEEVLENAVEMEM